MSDVSMQFELWKQCNNFCDFCYLAGQNKFVDEETKLENLAKVNTLVDEYFDTHSEQIKAIGFLGGEFFQGQMNTPAIKQGFYDLCKKCFYLINEDRIRDFWCYCTLTIGDQEDLYELVDLFDSIIQDKDRHKFWIQVSYDTRGRFNQPGKFENWDKHMLNLQQYPFICFNVTSIMTEDFLQKVLSGELDLNKFQEKYKNHFFLKQANSPHLENKKIALARMPWFFPKRKTYLSFLDKIKHECPFLFYELLDISLRADYMYNSLENSSIEEVDPQVRNKETWNETHNEYIEKCGHVKNYQCYADSNACMLCDYFKVRDNKEL